MKTIQFVLATCVLCALVVPAALADRSASPLPPPPTWAKPNANSIIPEESSGEWLVEVECVARDTSSKEMPMSVVKITHNYTGSSELVGKTFIPDRPPWGSARPTPYMLLPLGSKAIFVVQWQARQQKLQDDLGYDYNFPVFEKESERKPPDSFADYIPFSPEHYPAGRAYAASIERVAKAPRDEQIRLLKTYAKGPMSQLSMWSIKALVHSGWDEAPQFLLGLASDKTIPILAQVTLDERLQTLDGFGKIRWNDSPARFDYWQRLVSSPVNELGEGEWIVDHIFGILNRQEGQRQLAGRRGETYVPTIPTPRAFQWIRLALTNQSWPTRTRQFVLGRLNRSELNPIPRNEKWDLVLSILKQHPDINTERNPAPAPKEPGVLAISALALLKDWRPFTDAELKTLQELQKRAIDPEWQKQFAATLETNAPPANEP